MQFTVPPGRILFELFAMLELGAPNGVGRIDDRSFIGPPSGESVPSALAAWAREAVFQAATDEDETLGEEASQKLELLVTTALAVMWRATMGAK